MIQSDDTVNELIYMHGEPSRVRVTNEQSDVKCGADHESEVKDYSDYDLRPRLMCHY